MKFISLALLIFALIWTWHTTYSPSSNNYQFHSELQQEIKNQISQSILKKYPQAENLIFESLQTEPMSRGRIKASFRYTFVINDESVGKTSQTMEGSAMLSRSDHESEDTDHWKMQVQFDKDIIEFSDETIITAEPE